MVKFEISLGYRPGLHRLAWITAAATWVLILAGALVTSLGVGMAVPDWPTTFGHNMFTYPWLASAGGVFYEHGHRLMGSLVGILAILLCAGLWWRESRAWVRALGTVALALVCLQGVLGGLRVVEIDIRYAVVHGSLAQAIFAGMAVLALVTSRGWMEGEGRADIGGGACPSADGTDIRAGRAARPSIAWLAVAAVVLIFLQAVAGSFLRHTGQLVQAHLALALGVAIAVTAATWTIAGPREDATPPRGAARALVGLLVAQVGLGIAAWLTRYGGGGGVLPPTAARVGVTVAHVGVGALMLAAALAFALKAGRDVRFKDSTIHIFSTCPVGKRKK